MEMDWEDKTAREDRRYTIATVFNPAFPKITFENVLLIVFHTFEWLALSRKVIEMYMSKLRNI